MPAPDADGAGYPVEIAARYANTMSFRVPGKLIERTVHLGDVVRKGQAVAQYRQTVLEAFESVADNLVTLEEDARTLDQAARADRAATARRNDADDRYRLGAAPYSATLESGQAAENARIQLVRARAARLADTANLFQAMGNPPVRGPEDGLPHALPLVSGIE